MTCHQKWVLHPLYPISLARSQRKHTASKLAFHVLTFINKMYTNFALVDAPGPFFTIKELFLKQSNFHSCIFYTPSSKTLKILCKIWNLNIMEMHICVTMWNNTHVIWKSVHCMFFPNKCFILTSDWRCGDVYCQLQQMGKKAPYIDGLVQ